MFQYQINGTQKSVQKTYLIGHKLWPRTEIRVYILLKISNNICKIRSSKSQMAPKDLSNYLFWFFECCNNSSRWFNMIGQVQSD